MKALMEYGDHAGCLAILEQSTAPNPRMINMGFTAQVAGGLPVESAAVQALQACTTHGFTQASAQQRIHNNVLSVLSKSGPPEAVLSWIARMHGTGIVVDRVACNIALKAHCAMDGGLDQAVKLLTSMMRALSEGPPPPDAISFNTVISALAQGKQAHKAEKLLTTMLDTGLEADKRSFTGVIVAFARNSQPEPAAKWLQRMLETNVLPDTATFNAVLLAYANAADCEGCFRVLGQLEARVRDECPNARPDVRSFNTLLSACAKANQPGRAEDAFFAMEKRGITPNVVSFTTVLHAHARAGNTTEAQAWLDAMITRGNRPDAVAFNSVCAAHARLGDATAAMQCLERMAEYGVSPSPTTHSIVVNALSQSGEAEAAETMLRDIVASGAALDASAFNSLLHLHAKQGRPERAMSVLALMEQARVPPSLITFNSLASSYAHYGDLEATEDALKQAKEHGFRLDRYSYGALLLVSAKGMETAKGDPAAMRAKSEVAVRHVEAMLQSGIEINDYLAAAAARAVGRPMYRSLSDKLRPSRQMATRSSLQAPYPVNQDAGLADASTTDGGVEGAAMAEANDGWQLVTGRPSKQRKAAEGGGGRSSSDGSRGGRGSTGGGAHGHGRVAKPSMTSSASKGGKPSKSPIVKERPPPGKNPTSPHAARRARGGEHEGDGSAEGKDEAISPPAIRLTGVTLTRSKSDRARLLLLAQEAMLSRAEGVSSASTAGVSASSTAGASSSSLSAGLEDQGSVMGDALASKSPTLSKLKRSAASELALCLHEEMTL